MDHNSLCLVDGFRMEDLTNLPTRQYPVLDENRIQFMDLPEISETIPTVISIYSPEVMAVEDDDELKQVDQFHGEELEKPWKLISCIGGDKSSQSSRIGQEDSRGRTSDIMAIIENDENNPDYTRSTNRITKSWSTDGGWWMGEHLLFDILILLPVATLLRFKSVCKLWHALISSSNFIAQHLDHNRGKDNIIGYYCELDKHGRQMATSYKSCLLSGNKYEMYRNFDCENFVEDPASSEGFSADGIICIVHSEKVVDLWNPAMKQLRRLPESEQLRRLPELPSFSYQCYDYFICYGFGYCAKSDDYKIVRTFVHRENADNNVVEVYSLRADSWRSILEDGMLSFKRLIRPVSRNGTCFWIASDNTQDDAEYRDDSVVSFDLNDETFGAMPLPENMSDSSVLDFLGDKLAFISGLKNPYGLGCRYYEIWVLHEYGVKESWSKTWKIGPTDMPYVNYFYLPFGFSTDGDYLLLTDTGMLGIGPLHGGNVYMYNLGTQENEYIQLRPLDQDIRWFARCMESLVSVKRASAAAYY